MSANQNAHTTFFTCEKISYNQLQPIKTQISHVKNIVCSEIRILFQPNTSRKSLYSYNKICISHLLSLKNTSFVETYHFKNESCDICRQIASRSLLKTEQSTVNYNRVQKRKWDTLYFDVNQRRLDSYSQSIVDNQLLITRAFSLTR